MKQDFDVIIIGGGPAGLTAAIYARRAGKTVLVLEKDTIGGQIASAARVDNFPAVPGLSGMELSERLYAQAEALGAAVELEEVLEVHPGTPHTVVTDYGSHTAPAVILATGMKHRTLGLPGEEEMGGISFCAVCDGAFYEGRDAAVCGGGNTALQDALFLSGLCRHVTLIHRRDAFRADPILVEAARKRENITFLMNTVVEALLGEEDLRGLRLRNTVDGTVTEIFTEGLFEAVGQQPEAALSRALGLADSAGFVPAGEDCATPLAGIFTAGDCRTKEIRQLTTACADGAVAALRACAYCDRI